MDNDTIREASLADDADDALSHLPWDDDEHRVMGCPSCHLPRVFRRGRARNSVHFMLALGTLGLWLPVWGLVIIHQALKPWTCTVCGLRQRHH